MYRWLSSHAKGFDDLMPGIHLFNMAVEFTERSLLISEISLRTFRYPYGDHQAQWQGEDDDQAQQWADDHIMTMTPRMVTAEVINCVRLCCKVVLMLSMSLTARLIISPCVRDRKT